MGGNEKRGVVEHEALMEWLRKQGTVCGRRQKRHQELRVLITCCEIGLVGGLAVSTFSKTLAFLIGLMVFGVQVGYWLRSQLRIFETADKNFSLRPVEGSI